MKLNGKKTIFGLLLCGFILSSCGRSTKKPSKIESASGIPGPGVHRQFVSAHNFASKNPALVTVEQFGAISENDFPLFMVRIGRPASPAAVNRPALYLSDLTHGNEYTGLVDKLQEQFVLNSTRLETAVGKFISSGGIIYIVPVVNPWGYNKKTRKNANNIDLNRDFPVENDPNKVPTQIETKLLIEQIQKVVRRDQARLHFTVDYHCCAHSEKSAHPLSAGQMLIPSSDNHTRDVARKGSLMMLEKIAFDAFGEVELGSTSEMLDYTAKGTSKDYFYTTYTRDLPANEFGMSVTFEGNKLINGDNPNSVQKHFNFWNEVMQEIMKKNATTAFHAAPL
jgi:hypothetical protein